MDVLFLFIFALIAFMAARVKIKHKILVGIVLATLSSVFINLDHFFGLVARGTFHNIFVTFVIPFILFIIAFKFEKKGDFWKIFTLSLTLLLFSEPIADMFTEGGVQFFYPFSNQFFDFTALSWRVPLPSGIQAYVISTAGVGITIYFLLILAVIFIEDFLRVLKRDKKVTKAIKDTIRIERKKIKREL